MGPQGFTRAPLDLDVAARTYSKRQVTSNPHSITCHHHPCHHVIIPVKGPKDASTQQEVDVAAANALGLTQSQVSIYLPGKGFLKSRRMRGLLNEYFYQYSFKIDGEKTKAQFMRLPSAAKAG